MPIHLESKDIQKKASLERHCCALTKPVEGLASRDKRFFALYEIVSPWYEGVGSRGPPR